MISRTIDTRRALLASVSMITPSRPFLWEIHLIYIYNEKPYRATHLSPTAHDRYLDTSTCDWFRYWLHRPRSNTKRMKQMIASGMPPFSLTYSFFHLIDTRSFCILCGCYHRNASVAETSVCPRFERLTSADVTTSRIVERGTENRPKNTQRSRKYTAVPGSERTSKHKQKNWSQKSFFLLCVLLAAHEGGL
jgi:hypothetical protein